MRTEQVNLEKYAQVISADLMEALKESAETKGHSLDMEIAVRLMAGMSETALNKDTSLLNQIITKEFSHKEAKAECKRKRDAALHLYETEKLRLFLRFEAALPKKVKENFTLIDVKEESKRILAELAEEHKKDGEL
jgi:hypothetical protein